MRLYLASPFFNDEQNEREERVKAKLRELGFDVFSPKEACVIKPNESVEKQEEVFEGNINGIVSCDVLFAITDGKDIGTIWEAGFANGLNAAGANKTIVYYCETLPKGGKFNLMLARSADIVITKFEDLDSLYDKIDANEKVQYDGFVQ